MHFVLRTVADALSPQVNIALGQSYSFTGNDQPSFASIMAKWVDIKPDDYLGLVTDESGQHFPLNKAWSHYIMTDAGKTFDRIR